MDYISKYKEERDKELAKLNERLADEEFSKRFKPMIENGYTKDDFQNDYTVTAKDLERFDTLLETVRAEEAEGQLFLQGFESVPSPFR